MDTHRTTARIVGAMYLAGMVVGIGGIVLFQSILSALDPLSAVSANSMLLAVGAVLWLMAVVGDAAHGVLMFPVLKPHNERIAVGYLGFRIIDAVFIAIMVLFVLVQIPLGREYLKAGADASYLQALSNVFMQSQLDAYNFGMLILGVASLMLCYTLYRAKLVPRFVAVWGLVGYAIILGGSVLEVLGFDLPFDPHDSGRPVGAVHGGVAYCQRIQFTRNRPRASQNRPEPDRQDESIKSIG